MSKAQLRKAGLGHLISSKSGSKTRAGRVIHKEGKMNKTEAAFDALLQLSLSQGAIAYKGFETLKLRLASATYYAPDFHIVDNQGQTWLIEIKGHLEDDASVKFKSMCVAYPFYRFIMLRKKKGSWESIMCSASADPFPEWVCDLLD